MRHGIQDLTSAHRTQLQSFMNVKSDRMNRYKKVKYACSLGNYNITVDLKTFPP